MLMVECCSASEPRSTSNLVFSEWEKVFSNPMATAAAIDRIVHQSVIPEFDLAQLLNQCGTVATVTQDLERPKYNCR